jgi:hypothetical protein
MAVINTKLTPLSLPAISTPGFKFSAKPAAYPTKEVMQ